jgi:hypothetical protein
VPTAIQCAANVLQHCNASGHWAVAEDCTLTSTTCNATADMCVATP